MRKLATIQKISELRPIPDADKIETALMEGLGWEVVVHKDEFKVGDFVVFIEVDSIVPERPEFEFLRERKFKVKTCKFKKQVSQGLVIPLSVLGDNIKVSEVAPLGMDVSERLGITLHSPQAQEEQTLQSSKHRSKFMKVMMRFAPFRWFYLVLNTHTKGNFPDWISKTDEERLQNCAMMLIHNKDKEWYVTEKCDGQSATYSLHKTKRWGMPSWIFVVCSRNLWLKTKDNSAYWGIAKKYDLENKLRVLRSEVVIQGEICGPKIQGNKYGLKEDDLFVFTVIENDVKYSPLAMTAFCDRLGLKTVPIIASSIVPSIKPETPLGDVVRAWVAYAGGPSKLNKDVPREGIVVRLIENPNVSFKIINQEFLLRFGE